MPSTGQTGYPCLLDPVLGDVDCSQGATPARNAVELRKREIL